VKGEKPKRQFFEEVISPPSALRSLLIYPASLREEKDFGIVIARSPLQQSSRGA